MSSHFEENSTRYLDIVQIQGRGVVRLLTKKITQAVNLKEGDFLQVSLDSDGRVILEPLALIPRSERYLHSPAWATRLAEANQDISAGKVKHSGSVKELLGEIDRAATELED